MLTFAGIPDRGVTEPLPKHMKEHERLPLQEVPESIYEKASLSASGFSLFLHQNYLPFFSDIECVAKAAHYLSDSDVLSANWMVRRVFVITTMLLLVSLLLSLFLLQITLEAYTKHSSQLLRACSLPKSGI